LRAMLRALCAAASICLLASVAATGRPLMS
jgi:hypothetical protein